VPLSLSPEQRSLRASIGGNSRWAKHNPKVELVPVRQAWLRTFEDQVDPDRELPKDERERRAYAALRAHMATLALKSSKARAKRKKAATAELASVFSPEPGGEAE
jgi:hypothetical protein